MDSEKLKPWIVNLSAAEKKDRNAVVAELCKAEGLNISDAWKLLKGAGSGPDAAAPSGADGGGGKKNEPGQAAPVQLRHKTRYPRYRCAGLVLTQKPETYRVSEAQLEKLRRDPWVVIADGNNT
jgi:hypothetical protein